jgi:hypothetical protein
MEPTPFRSLVQQHLLPLFSGALLVPGTSPSPPQRPAVAERGRQSIEIKPTQATSWCLTITRDQPFARTAPGQVSEKQLAKAFVAQLAAMPEGFEGGPFAADLMARLPRRLVVETLCPAGVDQGAVLAAIDQLQIWSNRSYEGQPIVAAVGFTPEPHAWRAAGPAGGPEAGREREPIPGPERSPLLGDASEGDPAADDLGPVLSAEAPLPAVQLQEAWAEDFGAVLTNSFDTMLVSDYSGQLLAYAAMASPAQPPPLAPVRLGAVAQWSAEHPDRLALVLNRANELLVLRHGAMVFAHRAGSWFFLAPEAIVQQMGGPRDLELKRAVYASCLDASFAGTGACIGILNADATARLKEIAPEPADHLLPQRPGKASPLPQRSAKARLLQRAIDGRPFHALDRRLRQEILAIDGATILDHTGQLLAAGAILKVPGGSSGGGRRAAAVALAAYGVGIKVSADGGIEGFRRTTTVSEEGQVGTRMSFRLMK